MVDVAKLSPGELASHLGLPAGDIGVAVAEYMNQVNRRLTEFAYQKLALSTHLRVLEIGFGNGKLAPDLLATAPGVRYAGVDVSETMLAAATAHNDGFIRDGRAEFRLASVESLPFEAEAFDRALAVNTIYFWPDPRGGLAEIRRVLRKDGLLVLASMTPESALRSQHARAEYGFQVYDRDTLLRLHRDAGFTGIECEMYTEEVSRPNGDRARRDYHVVVARA